MNIRRNGLHQSQKLGFVHFGYGLHMLLCYKAKYSLREAKNMSNGFASIPLFALFGPSSSPNRYHGF